MLEYSQWKSYSAYDVEVRVYFLTHDRLSRLELSFRLEMSFYSSRLRIKTCQSVFLNKIESQPGWEICDYWISSSRFSLRIQFFSLLPRVYQSAQKGTISEVFYKNFVLTKVFLDDLSKENFCMKNLTESSLLYRLNLWCPEMWRLISRNISARHRVLRQLTWWNTPNDNVLLAEENYFNQHISAD